MRRQVRNLQHMWYSLLVHNMPVYEKDKDGNVVYDTMPDGSLVPRSTGKKKDGYAEPIEFWGNITAAGGVAEVESYGIDLSAYDAILYMPKNTLPLAESTLIWYQNEPVLKQGEVDSSSADYKISRVPPSLNEMIYLLTGLV